MTLQFFCHRLNRPGRIAVSLPSKNYQSRWNPCGNMNIIEMLWSVNLQRCIIITLSGNRCFLSLMVRYCSRRSNIVMRYDWCHRRNSKLKKRKKKFRFVFVSISWMYVRNYELHRATIKQHDRVTVYRNNIKYSRDTTIFPSITKHNHFLWNHASVIPPTTLNVCALKAYLCFT